MGRSPSIVAAFRDVVWPLPIEDGKRLADGLGWRMEMDMSNGAQYLKSVLGEPSGKQNRRRERLPVGAPPRSSARAVFNDPVRGEVPIA